MKKKTLLKIILFSIAVSCFLSCKINLADETLSKIVIKNLPEKTDYFIGEEFEEKGLSVEAHYSSGTIQDITDSVTCTGFDSTQKKENQIITVSYKEFTATFNVNILSIDLVELEIVPPEKVIYFIGDSLNLKGFSVFAKYNNNTSVDVTKDDNLKIEGFDSSKAQESQKVTVSYDGKNNSFKVKILPVTLLKITIVTEPAKLNYYCNETLDLTGLLVNAEYDNGEIIDVTKNVHVEGFDSKNSADSQKITVSYGEKNAVFTVKIIAVEIIKIALIQIPAKTEYFQHENIDLDGLKVIAEYNNDTTEDITNNKELIISGFDSTSSGKKTINLTYKEKTASFVVTVNAAELSLIKIEKQPDKINYYMDDLIDFTGMVVKAEYDDGSEIDVTNMVEITGTKNSSIDVDVYKPLSTDGKIKITVTYGNKKAYFDINVEINYVKSLTVIKSPFKDSYYPMEMVEIGDFEFLAEYDNGKKETIKEKNPNLIIKFENKKAIKCDIGTNTIVIQYKTQTTSVTFEVIEDAVTKLEILNEPKQKTFGKNQIISAYGLKLKVTYNSGKTDEVSTGWSISEDSFSTSGNKTVTVTYGGQSIKYEITVTDVYQFHDVITKVGNVYYFGDFPQTSYTVKDNDTIFPDRFVEKGSVTKGNFKYRLGTDNNYYYFPDDGINCYKVEPIKWRCIEENYNGGKLLLCENVISASSTGFLKYLKNNKNYSESDIRNLLNGYGSFTDKGFNSVAFGNTTSDELMKTKILLSDGNYVEDEIFILSTSEVINSVSETQPRINPNKFNNIVSTNFADAGVFPNEYTGTAENPCIGGWFLRPDKNYDDTYFVAIKFNDRSIDTNNIYPVTDDYFSVCGICPAIVVNSPTVK